MQNYILNGHIAILADLETWAKWFETENRIVKQETLPNGYFVSTVFLGIDYNFSPIPSHIPILFETMVFRSRDELSDQDMDRYSTWEKADAGHKKMVNKWKKKRSNGKI